MSFFTFFNRSTSTSGGTFFTEGEAKELTWAKIQEEKALDDHVVEASDLKEQTLKAAHELGEQATLKKLLLLRGRNILDTLKNKTGSKDLGLPNSIPYRPFFWLLAVLAFVTGILTNEWTVTGNKINLLSPPLLGVIAWNIIVYCWILVAFFLARGKTPFGPIRKAFAWLMVKAQTRGALNHSAGAAFYREWIEKEQPLLKARISEVLHFAAMMFGLGLIASIALQGWGTEYTVGWESTWLADKPSAVETFIKLFYGIVPTNSELFAALTPEKVAAMRFSASEGANAAPWLLQLFYVLTLVVILPRALLTIFASVKASYLKNHFTIDSDSAYYSNIFRQWKGKTMLVNVIPFSYPLSSNLKFGMQKLFTELHPENSKVTFSEVAHEDSKLPDLSQGENTEAVALFAMTATPESEVQGRFIQELKKEAQNSGALLRVLVDTSGFELRFAKTPQRIEQRRKTWSDFLGKNGVSFAFVNLSDLDSKDVSKQLERVN